MAKKENEEIKEEKLNEETNEEMTKTQEELEKEVERLTKENDKYYTHLQRTAAEFENYKKRVGKEKDTIYSLAVGDVVTKGQVLIAGYKLERRKKPRQSVQHHIFLSRKHNKGLCGYGRKMLQIFTRGAVHTPFRSSAHRRRRSARKGRQGQKLPAAFSAGPRHGLSPRHRRRAAAGHERLRMKPCAVFGNIFLKLTKIFC